MISETLSFNQLNFQSGKVNKSNINSSIENYTYTILDSLSLITDIMQVKLYKAHV